MSLARGTAALAAMFALVCAACGGSSGQSFTVTVTLVGSGTVTSSPAGINCGATCSATFASGTQVSLTPAPAAGGSFSSFQSNLGGGCSGATCAFTVGADTTVTASFAGTAAKLAFTSAPGGATAGSAFSPAIAVSVQDANGVTVTQSTASVALALSAGSFSGASTANAASGVATFNGLSISAPGTYTMTATSSGLTSATSGQFTVFTGVPLVVGVRHACTLISGDVYCWGWNAYGQLGNGTTVDSSTPVKVQGLSGQVQAIAAGYQHTCAVISGQVYCWGFNNQGQLGDNNEDNSVAPQQVTNLSGVITIAADGGLTCALVQSGAVWCWGANESGQLGNGMTANAAAVPVQVSGITGGVQSLSVGAQHTCAVVNGGVKCWGFNMEGEIGSGTPGTNSSTPVAVVNEGSGVQSVALGGYHSCALSTSGGVSCWGKNMEGELGNGTTTDSATPVPVTGLSAGVTAISGGYQHVCANTASGLMCWGDNGEGELGDNSNNSSPVPVQVLGLGANLDYIGAGYYDTCVQAGGGVQCWGLNAYGQLGNGTTNNSSTPVQVTGLP